MAGRRRRHGAVALGLTAGVVLLVAAILLFVAVLGSPGSPQAGSRGGSGAGAGGASPGVSGIVLGVGADETERTLAWHGTDEGPACVEYVEAAAGGPFRAGGPFIADAPVTRVTAHASGRAVPAGRFWFHATMAGLEPATRYSYRVGDCGGAWSAPADFGTWDTRSTSFLLLGDPQLHEASGASDPAAGWAATLARATSRFPDSDFLLTTGDHVDSADPDERAAEWELFLASPQLRRYAVAPTIGNHDAAGTGTDFGQRFAPPNVGAAGETVAGSGDYWFTHGDALFVVLNSTSPDVAGHEAFMRQAMAARPSSRWAIVSFHHSPFGAAAHQDDADVVHLREMLAPILSELGVDLVLGGHDHAYARSFLMDGTGAVPGTGGATVTAEDGQVLYVAANTASGGKFYALVGNPPWVAVANQEEVANYTHVTVDRQALVVTTHRTTDGTVVDRVTLRQAG